MKNKPIKSDIKSSVRFLAVMISFVLLLVLGLVLSINIGSVRISAKEVFNMIGKYVFYSINHSIFPQ